MGERKIYEIGWRLKKEPLWKLPIEPRKGSYFKIHHTCERIARACHREIQKREDVFDSYFKEVDSY